MPLALLSGSDTPSPQVDPSSRLEADSTARIGFYIELQSGSQKVPFSSIFLSNLDDNGTFWAKLVNLKKKSVIKPRRQPYSRTINRSLVLSQD